VIGWPVTATLGAALVLGGGLGLGGFRVGAAQGPSDAQIEAEKRSAYRDAYTSALDSRARAAEQRGYAEGLIAGRRAGRKAGTAAGRRAGTKAARKEERKGAAKGASGGGAVWAVGDGADGGSGGKAVASLIRSSGVTRLLYLGDVYDGASLGEFQSDYGTTFGSLAGRTFPTPGNHEWPSHTAGYDPWWAAAKGRPQEPWYAAEAGGWQLLSLNSEAEHGSGSPQLDWLQSKLNATPQFGTCRIAFWHRPLKSGGSHGPQGDVAPFWSALRGQASIVLNGHDHDMQRFAPSDGITEFVVGSGGHSHYPVGSAAGLQFSNGSDYGALRLSLGRTSARYAFVAVGGQRLDAGSLSCKR
jgi:hypothetical protein